MSVSVICPSCSAKLRAPDEMVGRKTKCPKCGVRVVVPGPAKKRRNTAQKLYFGLNVRLSNGMQHGEAFRLQEDRSKAIERWQELHGERINNMVTGITYAESPDDALQKMRQGDWSYEIHPLKRKDTSEADRDEPGTTNPQATQEVKKNDKEPTTAQTLIGLGVLVVLVWLGYSYLSSGPDSNDGSGYSTKAFYKSQEDVKAPHPGPKDVVRKTNENRSELNEVQNELTEIQRRTKYTAHRINGLPAHQIPKAYKDAYLKALEDTKQPYASAKDMLQKTGGVHTPGVKAQLQSVEDHFEAVLLLGFFGKWLVEEGKMTQAEFDDALEAGEQLAEELDRIINSSNK